MSGAVNLLFDFKKENWNFFIEAEELLLSFSTSKIFWRTGFGFKLGIITKQMMPSDFEYDKASSKIERSSFRTRRFSFFGNEMRLKFPSQLPKQTGPVFREHSFCYISRRTRYGISKYFFPLPLCSNRSPRGLVSTFPRLIIDPFSRLVME